MNFRSKSVRARWTTVVTTIVLLSALSALASPATRSVDEILAANKAAVGPIPVIGCLDLEYAAESAGLQGTAEHQHDFASGAFRESYQLSVMSGASGFDGHTPWQTDVSGVSTDQEGGDRIPVAVNEAYRNANLWWREDRGGARISYVGPDRVKGRPADHLTVKPRGGGTFDAWFDADTHMLVRTAEPQQFFKTQTLYEDYRPEHGVMLAHGRIVDFGTGEAGLQKGTLARANFLPAQPLTTFARPQTFPAGGHIEGGQSSVTVPLRLLNNHVYVQATVNGKGPYTFLVDTGGHTLIAPRIAREANLDSVGSSPTSGAGEKTETTGFAKYHEIALGSVKLTDQTAFIINVYDRAIEGIDVHGMLGFELFARFAVRLDYGAQQMTIADFKQFDAKDAGTPVPFKFYDHLPSVIGSIDNMPARFDIDTGSRSELDITSPFVARMKLHDRYPNGISAITGWGVGGASHSYVVRVPSIVIGGIKVDRVVADLSEANAGSFSDRNYEGNIGSGLLKRFVVTFDYRHQMMYLKPLNPPPADAGHFDRSGLWINAGTNGFTIVDVATGGPAAVAGVLKGDVITAINGEQVRTENLSNARTIFRTLPEGSILSLSLLRDGKSLTVQLTLRELL
jgi:predicted aspartyl protease